MSKLKETNTVIETLTKLMEKGEKTNYERVILLDIAKSLAIIADYFGGLEEGAE